MIETFIAFMAGLVTVLSPCVWPLLPVILGTSLTTSRNERPVFIALGFIVSFAATALVIVAISDALGLSSDIAHTGGIVVLFVLGLAMLIPTLTEGFTTPLSGIIGKAAAIGSAAQATNAGGFIVGLTLGVVWTPCAGPTLGTILTLIATSPDIARGAILIVAFAVGASLPMMLIAYGGQRLIASARGLSRHTRPLQASFGVLIILVSIAIYFDYDVLLNAQITRALSHTPTGTPS